MEFSKLEVNSCGCSPGCCEGPKQGEKNIKRIINIDFLYLDLEVCTRCQGTGDNLEEALEEVKKVLNLTGINVIINKIHIDSAEKAIQYCFVSSPTIRVNGRDIQLEVKESHCESCRDLCGDEVDCRVWVYEGREYTVPPKTMIIDAILRMVYSDENATVKCEKINAEKYELPENLHNFFKALLKKKE